MTLTVTMARSVTGRCIHHPCCPKSVAPDRDAALIIVSHPEQGWSLLCNGVVIFDDTGELWPDGQAVAPRRPTDEPTGR